MPKGHKRSKGPKDPVAAKAVIEHGTGGVRHGSLHRHEGFADAPPPAPVLSGRRKPRRGKAPPVD